MLDTARFAETYNRQGYLSEVPIIAPQEAAQYRAELEAIEAARGPMHYKAKMHTVLPWVWDLVTHPNILDTVEALIGPDILLYDSEFIIKEPNTPSFVSWHQDLTFWGLSDDAQVSLWLALSPANAQSGCMRMIPGSHTRGVWAHETSEDEDNVLLQSQTVKGVDEEAAVLCPLEPGQASFHHGWTLHASMPNESTDRRIGFNAQFIAPHVRQTKHDHDTALLVRGEDRYGHFKADVAATESFGAEATQCWEVLNKLHVDTQGAR
ncbi:phytanoyl-CoA dioxygenase family protein [Primorskyibacter sp. S187A]|uniref:phytanoyl-CoA dioxygenase family protein n=1 Tax=Primorskyibacter sp. S187A TaxID=3415130 RepID=UPI003C7A3245